MTPIPGIDHIIVANLSRRADRRESMRQRLDAMGLPFECFDAFDGRALILPHKEIKYPGRFCNYITQTAILREAHRRNLGNVLLLEDDATFAPDFCERAAEAVAALPDDWDMLYFGAWDWNPRNTNPPKDQPIYRPGRPILRHAVLHRAAALGKIIELIRKMENSIDQTFAALCGERKLNGYAVTTDIAFPSADSDA